MTGPVLTPVCSTTFTRIGRASPTITAYVEAVAVGDDLPALPIFLTEDEYVPAPLEETYRASWAVFPADFKELLEPG